MAMGLFGALKIIPWSDVVAAAPTVVRGAQQLWSKVRHDAPVPPAPMQAAAQHRPRPPAIPSPRSTSGCRRSSRAPRSRPARHRRRPS